jgi:hypothetical protein
VQAKKGLVTRDLLKYLIRPGDVLVTKDSTNPEAYISTGWIDDPVGVVEEAHYEEADNARRKRIPRYGPNAKAGEMAKSKTYQWEIPVWYWKFDGRFQKREVNLPLYMAIAYEEESIEITSLDVYPLKYAPKKTKELLERRGRTFWSMRQRRYVSYLRSEDEDLHDVR